MTQRRLRWPLFGSLTALLLVLIATAASAQSGSYTITSVSPSPFDPSKGQTTTITYTIPTLSNPRIAVRNSAGTEIREIVYYVGMPAGTRTRMWDGKDRNGQVVAPGTYTIVVEGKTSSGTVLGTATKQVVVGTGGTTTPPPSTSGSYTVTSVSPSPFNPSTGQTTTITYTVPTLSNPRIAVKNSAGTEVREIVNFVGMPAGTRTRMWDGKDNSGKVVVPGTYTIIVEGKTSSGTVLGSGSRTVSVTGTTTTPTDPPTDPGPVTPPTTTIGDYGQLVEGCGRANYDWFKNRGAKFAVAFKAVKTGAVTEFSVPWRTDPGYGSGNYGTFTWELQSNGTGNMPSGTVITKLTGLRPGSQMSSSDAPFRVPMKANLTAGQIYHLVIYNTDSSPSSNWSSINTVMTRVMAWDPNKHPAARGLHTYNTTWAPWSSSYNVWNTAKSNTANGAHIALVIKWGDGTITGDPYWSAAMSDAVTISGSRRAGQSIIWNRPTTTIKRVGVAVKGSGTLKYHIERIGGGEIASGTFSNTNVGSVPQWVYATLSTPITLTQGQSYRLWFEAPSGSFTQNPVYGPSSPSDWYNVSWGGSQSSVIVSSGSSWSSKPTQDLAFSLQ